MNLIRFSAFFLSLLIVPVYLCQAQENFSPIDKKTRLNYEIFIESSAINGIAFINFDIFGSATNCFGRI